MKSQHQRFIRRHKSVQVMEQTNGMETYTNALDRLTTSSGSKSFRQGEQPLIKRMKVGEVYAVRTPDNDNYYRTVYLKKVDATGGVQMLISNPSYGIPPDGVDEISPEQALKQMREMNAGTSLASLNAFPYRGSEK